MKILYDHEVFSYQKFGGISRYFCELIYAINKLKMANCNIATKFSTNEYLFSTGLSNINKIRRFPFSDYSYAKAIALRLNSFYFRFMLKHNRPDLVHLTYYPSNFKIGNVAVPIVITIHDMIPEIFPQYFKHAKKWVAAKKYWAENADHIIAVSENTKNDIVEIYGIDEGKVSVVYHATSFSTINATQIPEFPDNYIFYIGGRNDYKNFTTFIEAASPVLYKHGNLNVICAGGGGFTKPELELFKNLGLSDRLFQYNLSDSELVYAYKKALMFVFPSKYEGFGLPVLESFSLGVVTLLSNCPPLQEIGGNAAIYFDPYDKQSITNAIESVLTNDKLVSKSIQLGYQREKNFSWNKTAKQTCAVYQNVLSNK